MVKRKKAQRKATVLYLYASIVLIRYLLALATSSMPVVYIDEFLYYNLGRSIATEGKLLVFGQPANYVYILYPLVISPIYLVFQEGANFYRIIQLWNIMLMSASIFPINALSRKIIRNNKEALFVTLLCMLLPEFMLGQFILSEAIVYPLFFGLVYFIYRYIDEKEPKHLFVIGVFGGLMYCTKPGSMVAAVLFLLIALVGAVVKKETRNTLSAMGGLIVFGAVIVFFWCLARYALGYSGMMLSVYDSQVTVKWNWNLDIVAKTVLTYPYYFILSCGIVGFVYPFLSCRYWNKVNRKFWHFNLISLLVIMIGTAYVVNRPESNAHLLHIRYIAMYVPLMLLFCFLPSEKSVPDNGIAIRSGVSLMLCALLAFVIISTVAWGCKTGAKTEETYPLVSLSVLIDQALPLSSQTIGNIIIIILSLLIFCGFIKFYGKKKLRNFCAAAMVLLMAVNGACGYEFSSKAGITGDAEDALEALSLTDGHDFIYLKTIEGQIESGINVNTKQNTNVVIMDDFLNHIYENKGVYVPFVPETRRGYTAQFLTTDTDTLVLDFSTYRNIKINQSAATEQITSNGKFCVVRFTPGERLFDSAVGNVYNMELKTDRPGVLFVYDQTLAQHPLTIRLKIKSDKDQKLKVYSKELELHTIELEEGQSWYEVTFDNQTDAFNFVIEQEGVKLVEYELRNL